jgi:hypothetical protein
MGKAQRQDAFLKAYIENRFHVAKAAREVGISRSLFYAWMAEGKFKDRFNELVEEKRDDIEAALMNLLDSHDVTASIFLAKTLCKNRGYIEGRPEYVRASVDTKVQEILSAVLAGTLTERDALIKIDLIGAPIPPGLMLVAKNAQVDDGDPDEYGGPPSDDVLEAIYQDGIGKIDVQESVDLPIRRVDVVGIKKNLENENPGFKNIE